MGPPRAKSLLAGSAALPGPCGPGRSPWRSAALVAGQPPTKGHAAASTQTSAAGQGPSCSVLWSVLLSRWIWAGCCEAACLGMAPPGLSVNPHIPAPDNPAKACGVAEEREVQALDLREARG